MTVTQYDAAAHPDACLSDLIEDVLQHSKSSGRMPAGLVWDGALILTGDSDEPQITYWLCASNGDDTHRGHVAATNTVLIRHDMPSHDAARWLNSLAWVYVDMGSGIFNHTAAILAGRHNDH